MGYREMGMDGNRPDSTPTAVAGTVSGRVQGVSFRYAMQRAADRFDVAGWVRNLPDGRVAFHAEGSKDALEALLHWARSGPPLARVDDLDYRPEAVSGATTFEIVR